MRFLFACGGSGGHINPALAVADRLRTAGHDILFVGAPQGLEKKLVPREGYPIRYVNVRSLSHKLTPGALWHNARVLGGMVGSLRQARRIVREFCPDAALGTGGYASYPALHAAAKLGVPVAVHESNAFPGVTTRMLSRDASLVLLGMESAKESYPPGTELRVVGTPVRTEFATADRMLARERLRLDNRPLIVSLCGSQGARDMNRIILDFMRRHQDGDAWQHIHATGAAAFSWMTEEAKSLGIDTEAHPGLRLTEYIYDMPDAMAAADLVICRAGASTLAELMLTACPAILIPSPNVAADHQSSNARAMEALGAARMLPEADLNGERLYAEVSALLGDGARRDAMRDALRRAAVPDSAERIANILLSLAEKRPV